MNYLTKIKNSKRKKHKVATTLLIILVIALQIGDNSASAYVLYVDENVDADSDIDSVVNIGTDGATSFTDAQTVNAVDQVITEGNGAGYSAGTDEDELHDAITNNHAPVDVGTYSNDANMQSNDGTMNTLTEVSSGGGGAITVEGIYTGSCKKTNTCTVTSVIVPTSTDRIIYAVVSAYTKSTGGCAGNQEEATVVWDSAGVNEAFTNVGCVNANKDRVSIWKLIAPTEKTATVTLENTGSNNFNWDGMVTGIVVMSGVHQTTDNDGFNSNTGNSGASTVSVSSATGDLVLDGVSTRQTLTVDGSQTERWNLASTGNADGGGSTEAGATTVSMDWTFTSDTWASAGISINPASSGSNYEFDREFSFTGIATLNGDTETLAINTGVIGTESLKVEIWESSAWVTVVTIVDANDNTWINTSIATWMDNALEEFRFLGGTETTDTTLNTWEIDMVLINNVKNEVLDYELQWEHQSVSVDPDKDAYNVSIFGSATENIEIQTWDIAGSTWNAPLSLQISTTEQWYNQTIDTNANDSTGVVTWRYVGTSEIGDTVQSSLNIDWAGIVAWNFSMTITEATFGSFSYQIQPDDTYQEFPESPLSIVVTTGINFDIQILGADNIGTPVADGIIYWDTDSNPVGSTVLTTSYVNVYSGQTPVDLTTFNLYIWVKTTTGVSDHQFTITVQIVKA